MNALNTKTDELINSLNTDKIRCSRCKRFFNKEELIFLLTTKYCYKCCTINTEVLSLNSIKFKLNFKPIDYLSL